MGRGEKDKGGQQRGAKDQEAKSTKTPKDWVIEESEKLGEGSDAQGLERGLG